MLRILKRAVYEELCLGHDVNKEAISKHDDNGPPVDLRAVCLVRAMAEEVCGGGLTRNWNCKQTNWAFYGYASSNQRVFQHVMARVLVTRRVARQTLRGVRSTHGQVPVTLTIYVHTWADLGSYCGWPSYPLSPKTAENWGTRSVSTWLLLLYIAGPLQQSMLSRYFERDHNRLRHRVQKPPSRWPITSIRNESVT